MYTLLAAGARGHILVWDKADHEEIARRAFTSSSFKQDQAQQGGGAKWWLTKFVWQRQTKGGGSVSDR